MIVTVVTGKQYCFPQPDGVFMSCVRRRSVKEVTDRSNELQKCVPCAVHALMQSFDFDSASDRATLVMIISGAVCTITPKRPIN